MLLLLPPQKKHSIGKQTKQNKQKQKQNKTKTKKQKQTEKLYMTYLRGIFSQ